MASSATNEKKQIAPDAGAPDLAISKESAKAGAAAEAPGQSDRAVRLMFQSYYGIMEGGDEDDDDDDEKKSSTNNQSTHAPAGNENAGTVTPVSILSGATSFFSGTTAPVSLNQLNQKKNTDLDSTEFDIDAFTGAVMKDRNLKGLTEVEEELLSSIRTLDSDMQTLVYDNYNKFISATDTIREMKSKVENMDDEMKQLVNNMDGLKLSSHQLHESLMPNRKKISKLTAVRRLLENLNFLFNLPGRLKTAIELGAYAEAIREYKLSVTYLKQHSYFNSFERIQNETAVIMKGLQNSLRKLIKDSNLATFTQMEYARLLLDLQEPSEPLILDLLSSRQNAFFLTIDKVVQEASYSQAPVLRSLQEPFVDRFISFAQSFREIFIQGSDGRAFTDAQKQKAEIAIVNFAKELLSKYFGLARKDLLEAASVEKCKTSADVKRAVEQLTQQIQSFYSSVSKAANVVKSNEILNSAKVIIDTSVKECIVKAFLVVRNACVDVVDKLYEHTREEYAYSSIEYSPDDWKALVEVSSKLQSTSSNSVFKLSEAYGKQIVELYVACFQNLQGLCDAVVKDGAANSKDDAFVKLFYTHVDEALKLLVEVLLCGFLADDDIHAGQGVVHDVSKQSKGDFPNKIRDQLTRNWSSTAYSRKGMFLLILGSLCVYFAQHGIDAIFKSLNDIYKMKQKDRVSSSHKASVKQVAQVLRRVYVEYHGQRLGNRIEQSTKGLDFADLSVRPISIRPVMRRVLEELKLIQLELAVVFPDEVSSLTIGELDAKKIAQAPHMSVLPRLPKRLGMGQGVHLDIERIFLQKVDVFGKIAEGQVSPLVGIIKAILKSYLEAVRTQRITAYAFQQAQVDVFAFQLRYPIGISNDDKEALDCLLDEVLSSAAERCSQSDPQMDPYDVEQICRKTMNSS